MTMRNNLFVPFCALSVLLFAFSPVAAGQGARFELPPDAATRTKIPETVITSIERYHTVINRDSRNDAAQQGLAQAAIDLADVIFQADAVENLPLRRTAQAYISLSLADTGPRLAQLAGRNNSNAQAALGLFHALGLVVAKDQAKSCAYYREAARSRHPAAMYYAVLCVQATDAAQADAWMRAAAEAGHPAAQELIGRRCLEARPDDEACARDWLEPAAKAGLPSAMALMGWVAVKAGAKDPQALTRAVEWYSRAASRGSPVAQNNLGELYERGRGVPEDAAKAAAWYGKAAQGGFPAAQYNLGRLYWTGVGVGQNRVVAESWLRKAADNGVAQAQALLKLGQSAQ